MWPESVRWVDRFLAYFVELPVQNQSDGTQTNFDANDINQLQKLVTQNEFRLGKFPGKRSVVS